MRSFFRQQIFPRDYFITRSGMNAGEAVSSTFHILSIRPIAANVEYVV